MRRFKRLVASLALVCGSGVAIATPAMAGPGDPSVWLIFTTRNCPFGGNVTGIVGATSTASFTQVWSTGGDYGDNIVYAQAKLNQQNLFNGRVLCYRPWYKGGSYWVYSLERSFWPSYAGQNIYL